MPELSPDDDVAEWSDKVLMAEYSAFVRWAEYVNVQVALAEVTEETAARVHRRLRDIAMLAIDAPKGEVMRAKAEAMLDEDVVAAEEEEAAAKAYRKLITSLYDNLQNSASLLSRELTRRLERSKHDRRDARYGGA